MTWFVFCWYYEEIFCSDLWWPSLPSILYLWNFLPISILFNLEKVCLVCLSFLSTWLQQEMYILYCCVNCGSFIDNFYLKPLCLACMLTNTLTYFSLGSIKCIFESQGRSVCGLSPKVGSRQLVSRPNPEVCSAFQCCAVCLSSECRHMFSLAAPLSASVWAAVKRRCTHVENPGSRHPGLCYSSCPQWEGIDVYSVCFSMEFCLSAVYIQHRLFFSVMCFPVLYTQW